MGVFDFLILQNAKYLCNEFNSCSMDKWIEMGRSMRHQYEEIYPEEKKDISDHDIGIQAFVSSITGRTNVIKRFEYRNYTSYELNELSSGYIELLAFIGVHQGQKRLIEKYRNNDQKLIEDCKIIYEYIKNNSPLAISLQFTIFIKLATLTLYNTKHL